MSALPPKADIRVGSDSASVEFLEGAASQRRSRWRQWGGTVLTVGRRGIIWLCWRRLGVFAPRANREGAINDLKPDRWGRRHGAPDLGDGRVELQQIADVDHLTGRQFGLNGLVGQHKRAQSDHAPVVERQIKLAGSLLAGRMQRRGRTPAHNPNSLSEGTFSGI